MRKAKNAFREISTDLRATALRLAAGDASALTRSDRIVMAVSVCFVIGLFAAQTAFAAGDLFDEIGSQFGTYYVKLVGISSIVAATCIVLGFLWTMVSPGQKSSAVPIGWIKKVFLCYFCILILGGLFGLIDTLTSSYDGWTP